MTTNTMKNLRTTPPRRRRTATLLVALVLALPACGSRAPDAAPASSSTTSTATPATATTTPSGPSDPAGSASTVTTAPGAATSTPGPTSAAGPTTTGGPPTTIAGLGGNDPEGNPIPSAPPETFAPGPPTSPLPAGSAAYCTKVGDALAALNAAILASESGGDGSLDTVKTRWAALTSSPPGAIKPDVEVLSSKIAGVADASGLSALDQDPAVVTATDHLAAWVKPNCGFDPANPTA